VTALALALALAAAPQGAAPRLLPDLRAAIPHPAVPADTRCGACHTEDGWKLVRFAHERTGFPLEGRHVAVGCGACHPAGFAVPVMGACAACHRDPHAGQLGMCCGGCHDATSWEGRFTADAHRRTKFPLSGRHAFIPCEECHGDLRDRGFARRTLECRACHEADRARAAAVSVDHDQAGFGDRCQTCHSPWRFRDAVLPGHDDCFQISRGPHARIRCFDCHSRPIGNGNGTCSTDTARCGRCHACADVTPRHAGVLGFQCADRKCYECHRFAGGTP
jgi:hypothetical protein